MEYPPPADLKKFLRSYDREVQKLALNLRALLLEEMAPCYENIYDAYSAVAIGYGTSDRLGDGVIAIPHRAVSVDAVSVPVPNPP